MIRTLQRWWFARALTRITIELAAARERADEAFDDTVAFSVVMDASERAWVQSRYVELTARRGALEEELAYVRGRLAAVS